MDSVSVIQAHCSSLIASILFLLRLMIMGWKNLVFLSLSFSQSSLDFWHHKVSILSNHSNNLAWSASFAAPEFSAGGSLLDFLDVLEQRVYLILTITKYFFIPLP